MNAVLYKDFSDASECIVIQEGVPLYKSVDCEKRRVIVNGQESSGDYIPKQGDVILIRSIPGELVTVSLIVLAVLTVGAGIYAGIQAYQARKQADELTERMKNMSESATNIPNLRGASNSMAKGKTQPYIIGEHLFTPYLLTSPHYEITGTDGADQYYYAVLEGGFNNQIIRKISADDITLKTFSDSSPQEGSFTLDAGIFYDADARVEISQDGNAFAEAHFNAVYATQSPGAELKKADADDYEDLIYSLPQNTRDFTVTILFRGLRGYADDGSKVNRTVVVKPYYSLNSGSTWTEFTFNQNGTPSNTFTRNEAKEMRFVASAFPSYASVKDLTEPVLIKLVCETNTSTTGAMDQVYVQYVRSRLYDVEASKAASAFVNEKPIADTEADLSTRIGVKIKASLSNQDKLGKINVITSGVARTWTGSAWTTAKTATSNLAAWMLEVLTSHTHGPSQVDDSEIDLDAFGAFYTYCDTEEINVNHVLMDADEKTNVLSMLCDIGGAMLYENIYGEISVAVDAIKENSIAVLNTQNLLSFEVEREFSRETDGIRVSYISSEAGYQQDSYLVMRDGVTRDADSIIRDVNVQGITDYEQIVKYTRRLMAIEKLRPRTIRASVGKEGIYYTPLSKVQVQHPALSNGVGSAEIKSVIVEAGNITGLELYEPVLYDSGDTFGAIIQCVGADYCTPLAVQYVGDNGRNTIIELSTPISTGAAVIPHAGDTLSYGYIVGGEFDTITSEMLIIGIEPTETGYALTLVDYNEAIYDAGSIPDYIPRVTYVPPAVSAPVGLTPATLDDVNNTVVTPLTTAPATPASLVALAVQDGITLLAAPGGSPGLDNSAAYYHYQVSRDGGLTWPGDWTAAAQAEYRFDRDTDGYPDSVSLYRARVKAVSAAGVESVAWLTVSVDGTGYLGWTPGTPGLSGSADARIAQLRLVQAAGYYGHSRFEIQVQKDGDSSWYAPGDDGAARDSETAYRGTVDGYATAYADTFAQTLPLTNQAAGLPVNTSYLYRIRAVVAKPTTAAPDAVARSAWTSAITVVAKPTGVVDVGESAIRTAQLANGAGTQAKLAQAAGANLVPYDYSSFENYLVGDVPAFTKDANASLVISSTAIDGARSLRVTGPVGDTDLWTVLGTTFNMPVEAGKKYIESVYVLADNDCNIQLWVSGNVGGLTSLGTSPVQAGVWTRVYKPWIAPAGCTSAYIRFDIDNASGTPGAYFDAFQFEEALPDATEPSVYHAPALTTLSGQLIKAGTVEAVSMKAKTLTANEINVLATSLVNNLTDDANGTTGWQASTSGFSRVKDTSLTPQYMVGRVTGVTRAWTDTFKVGPADIIELEYRLRAPGTATTGEACLGNAVDTDELYEISTWDATAKAWGAFGGNYSQLILHAAAVTLNSSYKRLLSYVVGINVQPEDIPAPENGFTSTTYCARVKSGVARMSVVNRGGTGDLYFFAPFALVRGSGKITAPQIVTPRLSAISAHLGEINGDTADLKMVMGSGGSAAEGTLLLGATTDESYFRREKVGGLWQIIMKLWSFVADAVSAIIRGDFKVQNTAGTATAFAIDPVTGKMDHDGGRLYRFRVYNANAGMYWCRVCKIGQPGGSGASRFQIKIMGKAGWNGNNAPGHLIIDGSTNYYTASYPSTIAVGGLARHYRGNSANWDKEGVVDTPVDVCSNVYFVRQPGYSVEEVDVYLQWNTAQQYLSYFAEILVSPGNGETVTKYAAFTATDPRTAATDYYKLPMRRVIEESPAGLTTLADVEADSVAVDGAVSAASASVAGNAQVGSLNGATPGGGGLELLGLENVVARGEWSPADSGLAISSIGYQALAALNSTDVAFIDGSNDQLRTYRFNGSTWSQVGSSLSISGTGVPALAALNSTDVAFVDDSNDQLRTYRFNGSTWSQVGSSLSISGTGVPALAALNSTDVAFVDSGNDQLRTYRFNGSTWSQVDSGSAIISTTYPAIAALNSTNVAFVDYPDGQLRAYTTGIPTIPSFHEASTYTIERTRLGVTIAFESGCTQGTVYSVITGLLGTSGDIGCPGRYGTSDIGYLAITSTTVILRNINNDTTRIVCTKDSATTIPVRIVLQFPV